MAIISITSGLANASECFAHAGTHAVHRDCALTSVAIFFCGTLIQGFNRVFYLLNLHIKSRHTYFARAGTSREEDSYKTDAALSEQGKDYAKKMGETLLRHRETEKQAMIDRGGPDTPLKPLTIWTSTRRRTVETSQYLYERGYKVRQRSQMSQLNPGVCEKKSERRIRLEYPDEVAKHEADPYHHRYPRAEVCRPATLIYTY